MLPASICEATGAARVRRSSAARETWARRPRLQDHAGGGGGGGEEAMEQPWMPWMDAMEE